MKLNEEDMALLLEFACGRTILFSGNDDLLLRRSIEKLQAEELIVNVIRNLDRRDSSFSAFNFSYFADVTTKGHGIAVLLHTLVYELSHMELLWPSP